MSITKEITRIKNCKTLIREAIVEKGVAVPENDLIDKYPDYIKEIKAGGSDIKLQEKTVTIIDNGQQIITPDEGYALSGVTVNAAIMGEASALDFSVIGYPPEVSAEINASYNSSIMYSRSRYEAWLDGGHNHKLFVDDTKLQYAPMITISTGFQLFSGCSALEYVPLLSTANVTDMDSMFAGCSSLTSVPHFDTSNVTDMNSMFASCSSLTSVPHFDTSNVTEIGRMFKDCSSLLEIPELDTSKATNLYLYLSGCKSLVSVPQLDCSSLTEAVQLAGTAKLPNVTSLGGFKNLKLSADKYFFAYVFPNLDHQSLINVLECLYDFTGNGETGGKTISFGSHFSKLSDDEIAIATNKGWTITT